MSPCSLIWLQGCTILLFVWPLHLHFTCQCFCKPEIRISIPKELYNLSVDQANPELIPQSKQKNNWINSQNKTYISVHTEARQPEEFPRQVLDYK